MKAVQYSLYGDSGVLQIVENVQTPVLKSGQVLVAVHAAAFNPFDLNLRSGLLKEQIPLTFPVTFGGDFSGVVTAVGTDVTAVEKGDEVYGTAIVVSGGSGSFAQEAAANTGNIAKKPKRLSHIQAAALPLIGASAVQAVEDQMKLSKGQKIVIHGGAGGIGHIAVQLAHGIGAYVIATAAADSIAFVRSLGADEVIDYTTQRFETLVSGADAVFDTVGGDVTVKSFDVLKPGGILLSMKGRPDESLAKKHEVTVIGQVTKTNTAHLNTIATYVDDGVVKVTVQAVYPMEQVVLASEKAQAGVKGKVVVTMT